jgi:hypothetical protein
LVRVRKHEVKIDGEPREIILIRDFSTDIAIEKLILTKQEDNANTEFIQKEIDLVFFKHWQVIDTILEE